MQDFANLWLYECVVDVFVHVCMCVCTRGSHGFIIIAKHFSYNMMVGGVFVCPGTNFHKAA